jgi:large subunit ribosomal protein L7/L12
MNYDKAHLMTDAHSKKEKLLAKRQKLDAELKAIDARERAQKRKDDTRCKIILGGLVMKAATSEPNILSWLKGLTSEDAVAIKDRELVAMWFNTQTQQAPKSSADEAQAPVDREEPASPDGGVG